MDALSDDEVDKPEMCCNDDKDFALDISCHVCNNVSGEICRRFRCCHIEGSKKWAIQKLQNVTSLYLVKLTCSQDKYHILIDNQVEEVEDIVSQIAQCLVSDVDIIWEIALKKIYFCLCPEYFS